MREIRLSGSEGGARSIPCPYPYPEPGWGVQSAEFFVSENSLPIG